jgi:hypothetical protein
MNSYTVAMVTVGNGVFFTSRNDNREPHEVVADGIAGFELGHKSPIYESLNRNKTCTVKNLFQGLSKSEADAKKKTLIEFERANGRTVLNVR